MTKDSFDKAGLSEAEKSRREFMKVAGKLALYTPPALMLLMRPTTNAIAASAGVPQSNQYQGEGYQGEGYQGEGSQEDRQGELVREESEGDHSHRDFSLWP